MDLEELNIEYNWLKERLKLANENVKDLKAKFNRENDAMLIHIGNEAYFRQKAYEEKDKYEEHKESEKSEHDEVIKIKKNIEIIEKEAKKQEAEVKKLQAKINEKIAELRQNPNMKEYMDEVLEKRYARKVKALNKEKDKEIEDSKEAKKPLEEKKNKIYQIQALLAKHPSVANNIKGMANAKLEIAKFKDELYKIKDRKSPRAEELRKLINDQKKKSDKNQDLLEKVLSKTTPRIMVEDVLIQLGNTVIRSNDGSLDIYKMYNKELKETESKITEIDRKTNKRIKQIDKNIKRNTIALEEVKEANKNKSQTDNKENKVKGIIRNVTKTSREEKKKQKEEEKERVKKEKEERGIGFWNFGKRLSFFWERRQQKKLNPPQVSNEVEEKDNEKAEFFKSLRYDVVKDVMNKEQSDRLRSSNQKQKSEKEDKDR